MQRTSAGEAGPREPNSPRSGLALLYIAGAHRSGATPLGAVLAGEPTVFYGGELYRFPNPIFDRPDPARDCSCGAAVADCPFWNRVRFRLESVPGTLDALRQGQRRYERWTSLPRTLWKWRRRDPDLVAHIQRMGRFIQVLAEESGARTVVESSYNPLRGLLYRDPASGLDVRYLHLVRDGRSFVDSESRAMDRPEVAWRWVRAAPVVIARWVAFHLFSWFLLHRSAYLRVRYEEIVREPEPALRAISGLLGTDLSVVIRRVRAGVPIRMRHIAAGNRMRSQGQVLLRPELAAPPHLNPISRILFWSLGGWMALGLGYRPAWSTLR
jgi:hypothetical protein